LKVAGGLKSFDGGRNSLNSCESLTTYSGASRHALASPASLWFAALISRRATSAASNSSDPAGASARAVP
jgi:hypothetical protein